MVTPEWLSNELRYLQTHRELQESIIRDIARRIIKTDFTVTDTAAWQTEKLQQSGMLYDEIISEISKRAKKNESEIKKAFKDTQTEVFNYDDSSIEKAGYNVKEFKNISPSMKKIIQAALKKTTTEAKNLTKTTAITSQSAFIQACDLAHMQIASGAFTYQETIKNAIKNAAIQGANVVYPSGHRTSLDAAVRRAVLTGINQTAGKLQEMRADDLDMDIMEISAHFGARPSHAEWQGQLVSRSGKKGYLTLDDIGYGKVDGFMGANCRHDWFIFFEGVSKRNYTTEQLNKFKNETVTYKGENMPVWQALENQRAMERKVRTIKQQLVAFDEAAKNVLTAEEQMLWKAEFNNLSVKLKSKEAALKDFCSQTGLKRDKFREQVFATQTENGIKNFGKSVSQRAVWRNKHLDFIKNDAIIKSKSNLPKRLYLKDEKIKQTVNIDFKNIQSVVPKKSNATNVYVMAGYGTNAPIRDLKRLYYTYGKSPQKWQKKSADVCTDNYRYIIHWYEHDGFAPCDEFKLKDLKVIKK